MKPSGSGATADRLRTSETRKKTAVDGILHKTTRTKARRTVLNKTFVVMVTGFFSFVSSKADMPAPDARNANGNTAEGTQALLSNTTGNANTAIGVGALYENTT